MMTNLTQKEIAELFSNGKFDEVINYLSDEIVWDVVGENVFNGKEAVIKNCEQTAQYFDSVETNFKTHDILLSDNKVVITGTAEFKQDGKSINLVSACDIYEFNEKNLLKKILSYCITKKTESSY
jgi:ketosteroid isomerase-like protein